MASRILALSSLLDIHCREMGLVRLQFAVEWMYVRKTFRQSVGELL